MANPYAFIALRVSTSSSQITTGTTTQPFGYVQVDVGGGYAPGTGIWTVGSGLYLLGYNLYVTGMTSGAYLSTSFSSTGSDSFAPVETPAGSNLICAVCSVTLYYVVPGATANLRVQAAVSAGTGTLDGAAINNRFWGIKLG